MQGDGVSCLEDGSYFSTRWSRTNCSVEVSVFLVGSGWGAVSLPVYMQCVKGCTEGKYFIARMPKHGNKLKRLATRCVVFIISVLFRECSALVSLCSICLVHRTGNGSVHTVYAVSFYFSVRGGGGTDCLVICGV